MAHGKINCRWQQEVGFSKIPMTLWTVHQPHNNLSKYFQVREETALLVKQHNIECKYRDTIRIKGKKQPLPVYLISLQSGEKTYNTDPVIISDIKVTNTKNTVDSHGI